MIYYLPEIYPDELIYSWFCRYYVHSGYLTNKSALTKLLFNKHNNPSKEFIGHLNNDALKIIQTACPIKELIFKHTMYPQYARFIPAPNKSNALYKLEFQFCDAHHLFSIPPRTETDYYLKYCPICSNEDQQKYGEAYWHRTHQIRNMQICPAHNCKLMSSTIPATSEHDFTFFPAEEFIINTKIEISQNTLLNAYNKYLSDVFNSKFDFNNDISTSAILYNAMKNIGYVSSTGKTKYVKRLSEDILNFYKSIDITDIASFHQIQRVLSNERYDFFVVCQIAFYLGISIKDLTLPKLTKTQIEAEGCTHYMKGKEHIDWQEYDDYLAPILKQLANDIYTGKASKTGRPGRVTERLIYKTLYLPAHQLDNLPKCKAILTEYSETQEENWARRIIWAYNKLIQENDEFYWSDIRDLSGVKKEKLNRIMPYLKNIPKIYK